jgi:hypothetical protein
MAAAEAMATNFIEPDSLSAIMVSFCCLLCGSGRPMNPELALMVAITLALLNHPGWRAAGALVEQPLDRRPRETPLAMRSMFSQSPEQAVRNPLLAPCANPAHPNSDAK